MKNKSLIVLMALFLEILFLLPTIVFIYPRVTDNYLIFEQKHIEPKSSAGVDLTIVVTDQQMPGVLDVTDEFLASPLGSGVNSVNVVSSGTTANQQLTFLTTAMASASTAYDVIGLDVIWTAQFAENGWIIPLDSYLGPGEMDQYAPGLVDACTYDGQYYAYPYFMNLGILLYRKDLMDKNFGIGMWSESDFGTWEGLNATANYILNNNSGNLDNHNLVGYVGQFDNYEGGTINFLEIAGSNGATDLISSNDIKFYPNTNLADAMTFFQNLIAPQYTGVQGTPYIIPRSALVMDEGSSIGIWVQNNSIFMRQWTFAYQSSLGAGIDFGIAPLPHFEGATDNKTSCVGGSILAIPTFINSAQREAAINLTKFLGMPFAQEAELKVVSNFPALKSVYTNPPSGYEWISNWTEQLDQTLSRPRQVKYPLISSVISNEFQNILADVKTVNAGLTSMQSNIEDILMPGSFTLSSNANSPDTDGAFNLAWSISEGAKNYSLYKYHNFITDINQSLTLLANQDAPSPYSITGLDNGTYYYIVVAYNNYGVRLSNCISIVVEINEQNVGTILGYNGTLFILILGLTSIFLILKFDSKKPSKK
jgi:multiple sugar transport system substrate-binding protein